MDTEKSRSSSLPLPSFHKDARPGWLRDINQERRLKKAGERVEYFGLIRSQDTMSNIAGDGGRYVVPDSLCVSLRAFTGTQIVRGLLETADEMQILPPTVIFSTAIATESTQTSASLLWVSSAARNG